MSHKDFTAHTQGKKHQLALRKVDADLRSLPDSAWSASAVEHVKNIQKNGHVGSDKAASTAKPSDSHGVHAPTNPSVTSLGSKKARSTEVVKSGTKKAKRSKKVEQPKVSEKGIPTSLAPAGFDTLGYNNTLARGSIETFPRSVHSNGNSNYIVCNQECGCCGQYMNHLANEYVLPTTYSLVLSLYIFWNRTKAKEIRLNLHQHRCV